MIFKYIRTWFPQPYRSKRSAERKIKSKLSKDLSERKERANEYYKICWNNQVNFLLKHGIDITKEIKKKIVWTKPEE